MLVRRIGASIRRSNLIEHSWEQTPHSAYSYKPIYHNSVCLQQILNVITQACGLGLFWCDLICLIPMFVFFFFCMKSETENDVLLRAYIHYHYNHLHTLHRTQNIDSSTPFLCCWRQNLPSNTTPRLSVPWFPIFVTFSLSHLFSMFASVIWSFWCCQ